MDTERRKHPRYSLNIQVEITADRVKTVGMLVGTSLQGLRINTTTLIQPATDVVISLPNGERGVFLAGVVWVLDKSKRGIPSYLAGLKIDSVSVDGKELQGFAERQAFLQELLVEVAV